MLGEHKRQLIKRELDSGYTLIEVMAAMTIMGVVLAYSLPIYMFTRIKVENTQRQSDALIVMQKIITNLENQKISTLPSEGTVDVTDTEILKGVGRVYEAKIEYCSLISGGSGCSSNYRELQISVLYKGRFIYGQQVGIHEAQ
jgi:prepilin-type N-terminal cleavage/methylation domain-containing protein